MPRRRIGQERLKLGADQGRQTGSLDVPEVLLEDEVVISTRTRLAHKQHCSSCGTYSLPWGWLGPNRHDDLAWGGLKSACPPVRAVGVSRPVLVRAKG
jgi:hypothetical protein